MDPHVYRLARCILDARDETKPPTLLRPLDQEYHAQTGRDLVDDVIELAELIDQDMNRNPPRS